MVELKKGAFTLKEIEDKDILFIAEKICREERGDYSKIFLKETVLNLKSMSRLWRLNLRFFMIIFKEDKIIGAVDLRDYKCVEKKGELAYYLFQENRNLGLSLPAIRLFLNYLFINKKLNEVFLKVLRNAPKQNLLIPPALDFTLKKSLNPFSNKYVYSLKKEKFLKNYTEK